MLRTLAPLTLLALLTTACRNDKDPDDSAGIDDDAVDADGDGHEDLSAGGDDCDDADPEVSPSASEICDGTDNNCDGQVDEASASDAAAWYADEDGDGYGDAEASTVACDAPAGATADSSDCDDAEATTHPDASERCDGVDNDCDGDVDEEVTTVWYADADGDGFGDADSPTDDCDPPEGYTDDATDCDDTTAEAHPGAAEICDELDNDCDDVVDEDVTTTYYQDADGDGRGVADTTTEACSEPTGYASSSDDCDDDDATISPLATELCDDYDNDCDGVIDEDEAADADTWYADADSDGYGDPDRTMAACRAPSGYVDDDEDCDDADGAVSPAAAEVCNEIDDNCDGWTDDDDPALTDGDTWYLDFDGDGYGSDRLTAVACVQPSSFVASDEDCDDSDEDVNPDADEVCDEIDNDCDGDIDDDDASMVGAGTRTWYADADSDGYGDPDSSVETCDQPSGYVDNSDDCDDDDPLDTDGDGLMDCEDDDIDGDGLSGTYDADDYDDSIVRGPTGGFGSDGDLTVTGTETLDAGTLLASDAAAGDTSITVDDASAFAEGDELLVLAAQGDDPGAHAFVFVTGVSGSVVGFEPALPDGFSADDVVIVQRVPHYGAVDIQSSGSLTASAWDGTGGGVLVFRATDGVTVDGTLTVAGLGFRGGVGPTGNSSSGDQGESYGGEGSTGDATANGGGGGSYPMRGDNGDSGGGGGYGTAGSAGSAYAGSSVTSGGSTYGDAELADWFMGSGGGGGSPDTEPDGSSTGNDCGDGGSGGGLLGVYTAGTLSVSGTVSASGEDGEDASPAEGEIGGGGAGSGGQIHLAAPTIEITGTVEALGGDGGSSGWHSGKPYGSAYGGDGGDGRVRLDYTSITGETSPEAGHDETYVE